MGKTLLRGEPVWNAGDRFGIVVSRYNASVTDRLLEGAEQQLQTAGVPLDAIVVVSVPGAWELPVAARRLLASDTFAAVICLGCVIQGETTHDRYINQQVSLSLGELAWQTGIPVSFGVLTCQSMEQALQRAGGRMGNKGSEAAEVALELADLFRRLPPSSRQPTISSASVFSHVSDSSRPDDRGESFSE